MSSLPSAEGILKLRELAELYDRLSSDVVELNQEIRQKSIALKNAQEAYTTTQRKIIEQLEAMDCASRGNGGWEHRITWMLSWLVREKAQLSCGSHRRLPST